MTFLVNLLIGAVLGALFVAAARLLGRVERWIYQLGLLGAALAYVWIGLETRTPGSLLVEMGGAAVFLALGLAGVFGSIWVLAVGWAIHGPWDVVLPVVVDTSYMPVWYAPACLGFDLVLAAYLGALAMGAIAESGALRARAT